MAADEFVWAPDSPFGAHFSCHDANEIYPRGIIHFRVGQGLLVQFPEAQVLGSRIILRQIRPFAEVAALVPIVGTDDLGTEVGGWADIRGAVPYLRPLEQSGSSEKPGTLERLIVVDLPSREGALLGWAWLLVGRGMRPALESWISSAVKTRRDIQVARGLDPSSVAVESVDLFRASRCWLASVIAFA
ncbi:MAG: hypothetical protein Q8O40_09715 [Chloroflexota bacterium]|nr:hypothetical protein [Chloroflexota bacterium]